MVASSIGGANTTVQLVNAKKHQDMPSTLLAFFEDSFDKKIRKVIFAAFL